METSKEVCNGSSLGKIFHKIVENSLKKSRSNNNGKFGLLQKVILKFVLLRFLHIFNIYLF